MEPRPPVLAVHDWHTNADLMLDVVRLGYLRDGDRVLDPTYGRGLWWTKYRPANFTGRSRATHPEWDYTTMGEFAPGSFDVVAFDPPYVAQGGRSTIGAKAKDFTERYGMTDAAATPELMLQDICMGINASYLALVPGGILLCKSKPYISSGKLFAGHHFVWAHATMVLDFTLVDEFTHVSGPGMQPGGRRQVHARNNASTLFVFRKPGRRPKVKR